MNETSIVPQHSELAIQEMVIVPSPDNVHRLVGSLNRPTDYPDIHLHPMLERHQEAVLGSLGEVSAGISSTDLAGNLVTSKGYSEQLDRIVLDYFQGADDDLIHLGILATDIADAALVRRNATTYMDPFKTHDGYWPRLMRTCLLRDAARLDQHDDNPNHAIYPDLATSMRDIEAVLTRSLVQEAVNKMKARDRA